MKLQRGEYKQLDIQDIKNKHDNTVTKATDDATQEYNAGTDNLLSTRIAHQLLEDGLTDIDDEIISDALPTRQIVISRQLPDSLALGTAATRCCLMLTDTESGFQFLINLHDEVDTISIGRATRKTGYVPTVDLTPLEAHTKGVSRLHAVITRDKNILFVSDRASQNGTFINRRRLIPGQNNVLRDGDVLRLSGIKLHVTFIHKV